MSTYHSTKFSDLKRQKSEGSEIQLTNKDIILNYGIEIECVFDIINYLNIYIYILDFFSEQGHESNYTKNDFNTTIKELLKLLDDRDIFDHLHIEELQAP
jgi:hypothetical protein